MGRTYYDILEVSPNASAEVIRSAYKSLAKKYHPDVYEGTAEEATRRMAEINAAYDVLSDPIQRREYDSTLGNKRQSSSASSDSRTNEAEAASNSSKDASEPSHDGAASESGRQAEQSSEQQSNNSHREPKKSGCLWGLTKGIFKLFLIIYAIHFLFLVHELGFSDAVSQIKSEWSDTSSERTSSLNTQGDGSANTTERSTQNETPDGWISTCLGSESGKAIYALLPQDLPKENNIRWRYETDRVGFIVERTTFEVDPSLRGSNWANEKPDNTSNLTSGEFLFSMICEDTKKTYSSMLWEALDSPKETAKEHTFNGSKWMTYTISGAGTLDGKQVKLEIDAHCLFEEDVIATVTIYYIYDTNKASRNERKTVEDWLKTIPTTFEVKDAGDANEDGSGTSDAASVANIAGHYYYDASFVDPSGLVVDQYYSLQIDQTGSNLMISLKWRGSDAIPKTQVSKSDFANNRLVFTDTWGETHSIEFMPAATSPLGEDIIILDGDYDMPYRREEAAYGNDSDIYTSDSYSDSDPNARFLDFVQNCDNQYFFRSDLDGFDAQMAMLARNAPYAHAGRKFNNDTVRAYFEGFYWYYPLIEPGEFSDTMLNAYEKANMELVAAYEKEMGYK